MTKYCFDTRVDRDMGSGGDLVGVPCWLGGQLHHIGCDIGHETRHMCPPAMIIMTMMVVR